MSAQSTLIEHLRAHGIRITPQRVAIAQAVAEMHGHFSADDVCSAVSRIAPHVNTATVYRTLDLLVSLDLATQAHLGNGSMLFSLRDHADHHHAICRGCGASFEFSPDSLDSFVSEMSERFGFTPKVQHMVILGWCAQCCPANGNGRTHAEFTVTAHARKDCVETAARAHR